MANALCLPLLLLQVLPFLWSPWDLFNSSIYEHKIYCIIDTVVSAGRKKIFLQISEGWKCLLCYDESDKCCYILATFIDVASKNSWNKIQFSRIFCWFWHLQRKFCSLLTFTFKVVLHQEFLTFAKLLFRRILIWKLTQSFKGFFWHRNENLFNQLVDVIDSGPSSVTSQKQTNHSIIIKIDRENSCFNFWSIITQKSPP